MLHRLIAGIGIYPCNHHVILGHIFNVTALSFSLSIRLRFRPGYVKMNYVSGLKRHFYQELIVTKISQYSLLTTEGKRYE